MRLAVDVARRGRRLEGLVGCVCASTAAALLYRVIREALRSESKSRRGGACNAFVGSERKSGVGSAAVGSRESASVLTSRGTRYKAFSYRIVM